MPALRCQPLEGTSTRLVQGPVQDVCRKCDEAMEGCNRGIKGQLKVVARGAGADVEGFPIAKHVRDVKAKQTRKVG